MKRIRPSGHWSPVTVVGLGGLEPPTSRLSSARSNQLSYKPEQSTSKAAPRSVSFASANCASRLMPRARAGPAFREECGTARERRNPRYHSHFEERETKAAGAAQGMRGKRSD